MTHLQDLVHKQSLSDPEGFWMHQASKLEWHRKPTRALSQKRQSIKAEAGVKEYPHWSWFPDGEISTTHNCIERHILADHGHVPAILWDSPVTGRAQQISYAELWDEVKVLAGVLKEEGVGKGDVVLIYMPMIPAAVIGMLAAAHLGAIHAVVFGGFASPALAQRVESSRPAAILTASCGVEGNKGPLPYRELVVEAVKQSRFKPPKILIWQREELRWDPVDKSDGQRNWQRLVKSARMRGVSADSVPINSNDGLYIIYTSGTTGSPKGVLREAGGHAVGLSLSVKYLFSITGPGSVMFCASDIGWVVGHSFIVYGPLLAGASTVLFEGKPVGTPNAGTFWRIVEQYGVNALFTAPTALRAIRRDDSEHKFLTDIGRRGGLKTLKALFLAGERSEPGIVSTYQELLSRHAAEGALVIDNWWSSESGSPMTGIALDAAQAGVKAAAHSRTSTDTVPYPRPGSGGKPMPGFDVRIVDDDGQEVPRGKMGNIVLGLPFGPTGLTTLWNEQERFYQSYLARFGGKWMDTGDAGMMDEDGFVHVMSRADDVINVAAHRFSTGALEQTLLSHPSIAECCVVGIPDDLKGHLPFAFLLLHSSSSRSSNPDLDIPTLASLNALLREQIGPVAATLAAALHLPAGSIPKTRSGKTLRRVLRTLVENGAQGRLEAEVEVPPTVEGDAGTMIGNVRAALGEWFRERERVSRRKGSAKL